MTGNSISPYNNRVEVFGQQRASMHLPDSAEPRGRIAKREHRQAVDRMNAALVRSDQRAEVQARDDFNQARLEAHRDQLKKMLDMEKNKADAEVAEDMGLRYSAAHGFFGQLAAGSQDPALLMGLGEIEAGLLTSYRMRMFGRAIG